MRLVSEDSYNVIMDIMHSDKILDEIVIYDPGNDEAHRIDEGKWITTDTNEQDAH